MIHLKTNFGDMPDEQFHRLMSIYDLTYSSLFSDPVFENSKWKTYNDCQYLEVAHFEGFPTLAKEILIQSGNGLNEEAKANYVTASSSQRVVKSYSTSINYKPDHLINTESIDISLKRASRMFHILY